MAIKTMTVLQLATGRLVTINASDFDNQKYALPSQPPATKPAKAEPRFEPKPVLPPPPHPPEPVHFEVATEPKAKAESKAEEPEAPAPPRRKGR